MSVIDHFRHRIKTALFHLHTDLLAFLSVFHCIVQQIGKQTRQKISVCFDEHRLLLMTELHSQIILNKAWRHLIQHLFHQLDQIQLPPRRSVISLCSSLTKSEQLVGQLFQAECLAVSDLKIFFLSWRRPDLFWYAPSPDIR